MGEGRIERKKGKNAMQPVRTSCDWERYKWSSEAIKTAEVVSRRRSQKEGLIVSFSGVVKRVTLMQVGKWRTGSIHELVGRKRSGGKVTTHLWGGGGCEFMPGTKGVSN